MHLINLTPHEVTIGNLVLPAAVNPPRATEVETRIGDINGIPLVELHYEGPVELPAPRPGVGCIVSRLLAELRPDRRDLLIPAGLGRNRAGLVIGATKLARIAPEQNAVQEGAL